MTVEEALRVARENNPELQAARREREIARGRLTKARYLNPFNPEIGGEAGRRNFAEKPGSSRDFDVFLSQELEVAGQRGKRMAEAERHLEKVTQQVRDVERIITNQVKDAFYRTLYLKRRLELFRQVEKLNRRLRDISQARFAAGEAPKMEVNLTEIRLGQSRKDTIVAGRDYRNTLRELERLLGLEPRGKVKPVGQLAVKTESFRPEELLRRALETRPDLQAAERERERVEAEIALTKRLVIPNPTIVGFYREEEGGDRIAAGGVSIPLPVFDRKQAELTALAGRKSQARYERQNTELRIRQEVGDAFRSYEAAKGEVEVFEKKILDRATENFQLMETAYREGKINLLQVVVVQNDLVNAQLSYLDSLWNYWLARTALDRATGADL